MVEKKLFWTKKKSKRLTKNDEFSNTVTLQYTLTVWIMHPRLHGYCGIYQIFNDDNDDSLAIFFSFSSKTYDVVHIIPEVTIRMRCLTRKNCGRKKL